MLLPHLLLCHILEDSQEQGSELSYMEIKWLDLTNVEVKNK